MSNKSFKVDNSIVLRPSDEPLDPENGEMYFDKTAGRFKKYENGYWQDLSGASIIPTGVELDYHGTVAPSGFVFASGGTIGSATSGATERAHNDTFPLYSQLWSTYSNTVLPIQDSGGVPTVRGASAADDFLADKRLPTPDKRGRVSVGLDNMGGVAAGRMTTGGSGIDGVTMGASGGSQTHTLTTNQMPTHTHTQDAHQHLNYWAGSTSGGAATTASTYTIRTQNGLSGNNYTMTATANLPNAGLSGATTAINQNAGGGQAHNNTQPSWINTKIIAL